MPGGDEFLSLGSDVRRAAAMMGFLGASANVYDAFSAVMSSPWSTEKFTKDAKEDAMAREYVMHGLVISGAYALVGAWIGRTAWPIIGAAGVAGYMYWLYNRALQRSASGSGMDKADAPDAKPEQGAPTVVPFPSLMPTSATPWAQAA